MALTNESVELVNAICSDVHASTKNDCSQSEKKETVNTLDEISDGRAVNLDIGSTDESYDDGDPFSRMVVSVQTFMAAWYDAKKVIIRHVFYSVLLLLWIAYVSYAMWYNFRSGFDETKEWAVRLLAMNVVAVFCFGYWALKKWKGKQIYETALKPVTHVMRHFVSKYEKVLKWLLAVAMIGLIIAILVDVGLERPSNLISAVGLVVYITLLFVFSKNPSKVKWRPVLSGLALQIVFAFVILRTCWGFALFDFLGDRVVEFMSHTNAGTEFVFGSEAATNEHFFAFRILPIVIFFSTVISMLYYLGWMQIIIEKIAWIMHATMGTTAGESLNAAANIFIGLTEAPLVIKPLLQDMTRSELHAVMTCGFATIAGGVLATFILMGVPANHLLSASVMSAPAALAMSKLFYPETEKSRTTVKDLRIIEKPSEKSLIEAASAGATVAITLVANIAAHLIAFLALKQFLNETLIWLGNNVGMNSSGYQPITFELISSYVFWPFVWLMGADADNCSQVASLIGVKIFTNEFIAYERLTKLVTNRPIISHYMSSQNDANLSYSWNATANCHQLRNETYSDCLSTISERSEVIAIYALCGFANVGSVGVMIGGLVALAPSKKKDIVATVVRAMIAGNVACFMTACIAGLLLTSDSASSCPRLP